MDRYPHAVAISARTREGLSRLAHVVSESLSRSFLDVDVETGVDNGRVLAYLASHGEILSRTYHDSRVVVHCRIAQRHLGQLHHDAQVEVSSHASVGARSDKSPAHDIAQRGENAPFGDVA
jgi:GTP-binding protein HflX